MNRGWVAMDNDCNYFYYNIKPKINAEMKWWNVNSDDICTRISDPFNIEPVEDWTKSLIEIGGNK